MSESLPIQDQVEAIARSFPFMDLPREEVSSALRGRVAEITFQTGEEILKPGELPSALYLIL